MKNMRIPIRPAPSVEEARRKSHQTHKNQNAKKKPPPRPPPPDLSKVRSKSTWVLNQRDDDCLIEWSPPSSPRSARPFGGGSVSSSFNSSTSSLASSKRSFEMDAASPFNVSPWNGGLQTSAQISAPTIIRAHPPKKARPPPKVSRSPPMPTVPPPSPPKEVHDEVVPFALALYNYPGNHPDDLPLQENDIVYLTKRLNSEWLRGRVGDREGMFPAGFVEVKVPLPNEEDLATAVYEFRPQAAGDLALRAGQSVRVLRRVAPEWLYGEADGARGQFPASFVDRVPPGV